MLKINLDINVDEKISKLRPVVILHRLETQNDGINFKPKSGERRSLRANRESNEKQIVNTISSRRSPPQTHRSIHAHSDSKEITSHSPLKKINCDEKLAEPTHILTAGTNSKNRESNIFQPLKGVTSQLDTKPNSNVGENSYSLRNSQKKLQSPPKKDEIEERRFKCSECEESFHTIILLAVHKRIHDQESEQEDNDILELGNEDCGRNNKNHENLQVKYPPHTGNCNDSSRKILPESSEISHDKSQEDQYFPASGHSSSLSNNVRAGTVTTLPCKDTVHSSPPAVSSASNVDLRRKKMSATLILTTRLPGTGLSISHSSNEVRGVPVTTPCVHDHDYCISFNMDPRLLHIRGTHDKSNSQAKESRMKRNSKPTLMKCRECPASFSKQWYIDLHLKLLHLNNKNTSLSCPAGCAFVCWKEDELRKHIWKNHFQDYNIMNNEITSSLGMTTDALTGEHLKTLKIKPPYEDHTSEKRIPSNIFPQNISCDWNKATPFQKDIILDLIEAELRHILVERNKLGDHFSFADLQRLALEICESLSISKFFDGQFSKSKRWAQRILSKAGQIPRPGRFRFVHNLNSSYLNAVVGLSARGLSEATVFYAFEARVCDVSGNGTLKTVSKTSLGNTSPEVSIESTVCSVLCTNANGSVILQPTIVYQGQIVDSNNIHKMKRAVSHCPSKDLVETEYFKEWFAQFILSIPPARPIILLVEGHMSQLSYSIIKMAREDDIHIVFLPSRKRFVHSHQLIRESLLAPLFNAFEKESQRYQHIHLKNFYSVFDSAWLSAVVKVKVTESFTQAGFLPLSTSKKPLEEAAKGYLADILTTKRQDRAMGLCGPGSDTSECSPSPGPSNPDSDNLRLEEREEANDSGSEEQHHVKNPGSDKDNALPIEIKEEPMDLDDVGSLSPSSVLDASVAVKDEPMEDPLGAIKEEPMDGSPFLGHVAPVLDGQFFKEEDDSSSQDSLSCHDCGRDFQDKSDFENHDCFRAFDIGQSSRECALHSCPTCSMSFALKATLEFHLTTHEKKKEGQRVGQTKSGVSNLHKGSDGRDAKKRLFIFTSGGDHQADEVPTKKPKQVSFSNIELKYRSSSPATSTSSASSSSSRTLTASPGSSSSGTLTASASASPDLGLESPLLEEAVEGSDEHDSVEATVPVTVTVPVPVPTPAPLRVPAAPLPDEENQQSPPLPRRGGRDPSVGQKQPKPPVILHVFGNLSTDWPRFPNGQPTRPGPVPHIIKLEHNMQRRWPVPEPVPIRPPHRIVLPTGTTLTPRAPGLPSPSNVTMRPAAPPQRVLISMGPNGPKPSYQVPAMQGPHGIIRPNILRFSTRGPRPGNVHQPPVVKCVKRPPHPRVYLVSRKRSPTEPAGSGAAVSQPGMSQGSKPSPSKQTL